MRSKLEVLELEVNDPNLQNVERVLPGVNRQFDAVRATMRELNVEMSSMKKEIIECIDDGNKQNEDYFHKLAEFVDNQVRDGIAKSVKQIMQGQQELIGKVCM